MKVEQILPTVTGRRRRRCIRRTETARAHVLGTTSRAYSPSRNTPPTANAATTRATPATAHPVQVPETVEHSGAVY